MSIAHETVFPDLDEIPIPEGSRYAEIVDGRPVEKPLMGAATDHLMVCLIMSMARAGLSNQGLFFGSTSGYQIFADNPRRVRIPDLSFIRKGRLPGNKPPRRGYLKIVPDLVVEFVSPNDNAENVEIRLNDFLTAGVPLAWMVYPATRHVYVDHQGTPALRLGPGDTLDGEDVLPGFACPVSELFASL